MVAACSLDGEYVRQQEASERGWRRGGRTATTILNCYDSARKQSPREGYVGKAFAIYDNIIEIPTPWILMGLHSTFLAEVSFG